jgi:hypothetical protein
MDLATYIMAHSTYAVVAATIFSVLLGFTIFILSQDRTISHWVAILLGFGIFGAIIAFGISIFCLGSASKSTVSQGTIWASAFFLFISLIAIAILTVFSLGSMAEEKLERKSERMWPWK